MIFKISVFLHFEVAFWTFHDNIHNSFTTSLSIMASKSEEQRKQEEVASRRHARLDNAGVLHMSAAGELPDKITIVSISWSRSRRDVKLTLASRPRARLLGMHLLPLGGGPHPGKRPPMDDHEGVSCGLNGGI